ARGCPISSRPVAIARSVEKSPHRHRELAIQLSVFSTKLHNRRAWLTGRCQSETHPEQSRVRPRYLRQRRLQRLRGHYQQRPKPHWCQESKPVLWLNPFEFFLDDSVDTLRLFVEMFQSAREFYPRFVDSGF